MRARRTMRVPTAAHVAVGATVLVFPVTAVAVTTTDPATVASRAATLHSSSPRQIAYGHATVVRGSAPRADAGRRLKLEYRPSEGRWRTVARGRVHRDGRFRLSARIVRSGSLQVVAVPPVLSVRIPASAGRIPVTGPAAATSTSTSTSTPLSAPRAPAPMLKAAPVRAITVRPRLWLQSRDLTAIAGQAVEVAGRLLPGDADRRVDLEVRGDGRWFIVARTRTRAGGSFSVRYVPALGSALVRLAFPGDRHNSRAFSGATAVSAMQYAEVSWYEDAGSTACGFHATYGIASRTLPCGAQVTLSYGGRTVTATVDDRGPYVLSRLYDLNQNVAGVLGMYGVATVLASQ